MPSFIIALPYILSDTPSSRFTGTPASASLGSAAAVTATGVFAEALSETLCVTSPLSAEALLHEVSIAAHIATAAIADILFLIFNIIIPFL
ncbi:MAG: hypothetical protein HDT24_05895 [Ruminococcus sp.]|nr:hypothetical protein [Ruminococcus sp.]